MMESPNGPCGPTNMMMVHAVIAVFTGLNALLTTWLTLRARGRDKKEAERRTNDRHRHRSA